MVAMETSKRKKNSTKSRNLAALSTVTGTGEGSVFAVIEEQEVAERVELLTRFRRLLIKQRERFSSYLRTLEVEGDAIRNGDVEHFERHVQLEQAIVKDIISFRRASDPLEDLYHRATGRNAGEEGDIPELKAHLDHLQTQILRRNEENREQLRSRLEELRQEVARIRNPYKNAGPRSSAASAGMVDITT
ncbi:MAG TPA: flagellar biosynthesis protein FlgN [Spirochaetia bacterium]|nr:flagellar biosynthesis protein FlgN [Spirochaetia bacterium]